MSFIRLFGYKGRAILRITGYRNSVSEKFALLEAICGKKNLLLQWISNLHFKNESIMRVILFWISSVLLLASCTQKWEYKIVAIKGVEKDDLPSFVSKRFDISDETLNLFGKKGWELVDVYSTIETVHPNFGNSEYVSGLQPNVRVEEISFVFKRKK